MPHRGIRAPKGTEYTSFLVTDRFDIHSESLTYHCNRLNAHNKGIRDQVSRVGFGILLPELTENVLRGTHAIMMSDKVAFEETVKDASYNSVSYSNLNWKKSILLLHSANHSMVNLSLKLIDGHRYIASPRITHSGRVSPMENVPTIFKRLLSFS